MAYYTCFSHLKIGDLEARHPCREGLRSRREHRKAGDDGIVRKGVIERTQPGQTKGTTTETTHKTPRVFDEIYRKDNKDNG